MLAVGRLVRALWFRAPVAPPVRTFAAPADSDRLAAPLPLLVGVAPRWTLAFVVAMGAEFALGLFAPALPALVRAVAGALAAG